MSEPEDIISDAARHAFGAAQKLWTRRQDLSIPEEESLAFHRRRLELFVSALFNQDIPIRPSQPPEPPPMLRRLFGRPQRFVSKSSLPGCDASSIYLPRRLAPRPGDVRGPASSSTSIGSPQNDQAPFQRYRLWAVLQAAKVVRGTGRAASRLARQQLRLVDAEKDNPWGKQVYRDHAELSGVLFALSEAFTSLETLKKELPGLREGLESLVKEALEARPQLEKLSAIEALVERWYRVSLGAQDLQTRDRMALPERKLLPDPKTPALPTRALKTPELQTRDLQTRDLKTVPDPKTPTPNAQERSEQRRRNGEEFFAQEEDLRGVFEPDFPLPPLPTFATPNQSAQWALLAAANLLSLPESGRFRGFLPDFFTGSLLLIEGGSKRQGSSTQGQDPEAKEAKQQVVKLRRRPRVRNPDEDEDDSEPGMWMMQMDDPQEHVEDPFGIERPTDRESGDNPGDVADSLAELEEARIVHTPERSREVFESDDPPDARLSAEAKKGGQGIVYPEWDYRRKDYRLRGATVWLKKAELGDRQWASAVREQRRPLLQEVRRRFEGLRPRRVLQKRQSDGDELDLAAYVEARADWHAGVAAEDRFYLRELPQRRDLAVYLLVDVSASTDAWVKDDLRIIDVEKEAVLVCCHALDTLGDPYAISAFSGEGPHGVRVWPLKDFEEAASPQVDQRIAALEPDNYTRAGAALRHATASLAARKESKRLLLLLSDGKPNDLDEYGGQYGVEDLRLAVTEASAAGLHTFCLTVDRDAPAYLQQIFGPSRHTVLAHASQLPAALVDVLRHLLR